MELVLRQDTAEKAGMSKILVICTGFGHARFVF